MLSHYYFFLTVEFQLNKMQLSTSIRSAGSPSRDYIKKKSALVLDKELAYQLARADAEVVCSNILAGVIIFSKGYQKPDLEKLPAPR